MKVWLNGSIVEEKDAMISLSTHSLHYGDSVFEGIHSYETSKGVAVFRLTEHMERLISSAEPLSLKIDYSVSELVDAVKKLIAENGLKEAYIRPIAYYGAGSLDVYPKDITTDVGIIAVPYEPLHRNPISVMTSSFKRVNASASRFGAKIGGFYANSIMAMHEAREKGFDEALMLDSNNLVAEGPCHNIFMVKDSKLITSLSGSILPGITRMSLLTIGKDLGYETLEKEITLDEVKKADEVFYCGTLSEVIPIKKIDDSVIGDESMKITEEIKNKFKDVVSGKDDNYSNWLEYV